LDQQPGREIGGPADADPVALELVDQHVQQAVVAAILAPREEMRHGRLEHAQVGQVAEPSPRLKQHGLVDLAGHHRLGDAVPLEIADRRTEPCQPDPGEIVAALGQIGAGVAAQPQAIDMAPGLLEGAGDDSRVVAPACDQPDAARPGRRRRGGGRVGRVDLPHRLALLP